MVLANPRNNAFRLTVLGFSAKTSVLLSTCMHLYLCLFLDGSDQKFWKAKNVRIVHRGNDHSKNFPGGAVVELSKRV